MKVLKTILFLFLGLVGIALIAAAILPKNYEVIVSDRINAPHAKVYDYVRMFSTQKEYSEWMKPDPNVKLTIEGKDGELGAKFNWAGNSNVGEGSILNKKVTPELIEQELNFIKPMASKAFFNTSFKAIDSTATDITMTMYGEDPYPFNLMSHLFGVPMIEKTEKKNMANLKGILESK
jgi:hypothetical protein